MAEVGFNVIDNATLATVVDSTTGFGLAGWRVGTASVTGIVPDGGVAEEVGVKEVKESKEATEGS